jgi:hypothetical protein
MQVLNVPGSSLAPKFSRGGSGRAPRAPQPQFNRKQFVEVDPLWIRCGGKMEA